MVNSEQDALRAHRLQMFLNDTNGPPGLSVESIRRRADAQVALAEIDGIFAGLNYLEKAEPLYPATAPSDKQALDVDVSGFYLSTPKLDQFELPNLPEELLLDIPDEIPSAPQQQAENTDKKKRAWSELRSLRQGIQEQFDNFNNLSLVSTYPRISKLRDYYPDAEALGQKGILAYRDVLQSVLPETMAEIFAFACLSFVISSSLSQQGRIRSDQVLGGLHHWRDSIFDDDDKLAFDLLASAMWPRDANGIHCRPDRQSGKGGTLPVDLGFLGLNPLLQATNQHARSGPGSASEALKQAAELTSAEFQFFSEALPDESIIPFERDASNLLGLSHEEFNFAQFGTLGFTAGSQLFQDQHAPTSGDQRHDFNHFAAGPIPGYTNPPFYPSFDFPCNAPAPVEYPFRVPQPDTGEPKAQIELRILDKTSDLPTHAVKNTEMFLAVLAFGKEYSDFFFALSGSGQTVVYERRGLAFGPEKFENARVLREEFFEPLKKRMSDNPQFLALLSVAEKFVVLGTIGSLQNVHVFLLDVAEPFLEHREVSGAFTHELERHLGSFTSSSPETEGPNATRPLFPCKFPGCDKAYKDPSGLSKHAKASHNGGVVRIRCPKTGCKYISHRRDAVRQHFKRLHSSVLPPSLQERRPRHS